MPSSSPIDVKDISAFPEDRLARLFIEKSGLASVLPFIVDQIEEDLSGQYEAIIDEEDSAGTPSYGGLCYTSYTLVSEGKPNAMASKRLSDLQLKVLNSLCDEGEFEISVCRDDSPRHEYSFAFSVPKVPNQSVGERIFLYVRMKLSVHAPQIYKLDEVSYSEDLLPADLDKLLLVYTLSLS